MNPILIKVVPSDQIRNNGLCDWFDKDGVTTILISDLIENEDYIITLAIHELMEKRLCDKAGITDEQVTSWDEKHIPKSGSSVGAGALPDSPYVRQHNLSLGVECAACAAFGYDWEEYDKFIMTVGIDDSQLTCAGVDKER